MWPAFPDVRHVHGHTCVLETKLLGHQGGKYGHTFSKGGLKTDQNTIDNLQIIQQCLLIDRVPIFIRGLICGLIHGLICGDVRGLIRELLLLLILRLLCLELLKVSVDFCDRVVIKTFHNGQTVVAGNQVGQHSLVNLNLFGLRVRWDKLVLRCDQDFMGQSVRFQIKLGLFVVEDILGFLVCHLHQLL